ncbi:MAG: ABC transporter ATP-binding protein [Nocardioides sp.]|nr:ABC transporter ATP-binding protein [Nocardioides sp.]
MISIRDLGVHRGRREVLRGVTVDVAPGEWLGLVGPNGSGKSTLLGAVAGLVPHTGSVRTGSARTGRRRPGATDLALMPQRPAWPEGMTVAEYVLLGRTPHLGWLVRESPHDRRLVAEVLDRLDLARWGGRPVGELSGGEAQRVAIARALAQQAPVLLLDEPTSALDLGMQAAVLDLVQQLRRCDGLSVVAAMHDLGTAARHADRLLLLSAGEVAALGPPQEVLRDDLLSQVYDADLRVHHVDGEPVVLAAPNPRQELR